MRSEYKDVCLKNHYSIIVFQIMSSHSLSLLFAHSSFQFFCALSLSIIPFVNLILFFKASLIHRYVISADYFVVFAQTLPCLVAKHKKAPFYVLYRFVHFNTVG